MGSHPSKLLQLMKLANVDRQMNWTQGPQLCMTHMASLLSWPFFPASVPSESLPCPGDTECTAGPALHGACVGGDEESCAGTGDAGHKLEGHGPWCWPQCALPLPENTQSLLLNYLMMLQAPLILYVRGE